MAPAPPAASSRRGTTGRSPRPGRQLLLPLLLPLAVLLLLGLQLCCAFGPSNEGLGLPRQGRIKRPPTMLATAATAAANGAGAGGKRVAVLGAGAAGLVASRLLRDAGFGVRCFEKTDSVGGVWRYRPEDVMYGSLVTNLPKEIMAYLDLPFDPALPSFLGHAQVQAYLEEYAARHHLRDLVSFRAEVKAVRPVGPMADGKEGTDCTVWRDADGDEEEGEPRWRVTYEQAGGGTSKEEEFDAVVVCNGHFDVPYTPPFPGLRDCFKGRVLHSRHYDDPGACAGLRVLCVGYKSSGTDIAREVAQVARDVHVVDRRVKGQQQEQELQRGNIFRRPELRRFLEDGRSVEFADGSVLPAVDLVLFCTGYEYAMPFLRGGAPPTAQEEDKQTTVGGPRLLRVEDRAVFPVYQHLFHAHWPSLAFMGLLHSVVPFPLFDLQAQWIVQHLLGKAPLPPRRERFAWLGREQERQRLLGRKPRDFFYQGPEQWPYLRMMAQQVGCLTPALEEELAAREGVYNDVSRRRPAFPGADDSYRRCEYRLLPGGKWEVDASRFEPEGNKTEPAFL